jgi:hypothetical protein
LGIRIVVSREKKKKEKKKKKKEVRTEKGEDIGAAFEVVRANELPGELLDGHLDLALGLDSGDGERGDEWKGTEDDETDESGGEHSCIDLGSPMMDNRFPVVRLAELKVVIEPTSPDHVQRGSGGPMGEIDEHVGCVIGFWHAALCTLDVGSELGLQGRGDAPYLVVHVSYIL